MNDRRRYAEAAALRQPVDLPGVPPELAIARAAEHARIAVRVINARHATKDDAEPVAVETFEKLCVAMTKLVLKRTPRAAVHLGHLCALAGVNEHRVRARLVLRMIEASALAIRLMQAEFAASIGYDLVYSQTVDTGNGRSFGAFGGRVRNIVLTGVSDHTACPDRLMPFASGTQHDYECPEADLEAIALFQSQLSGAEDEPTLPGNVLEHLEAILEPHEQLRDLVRRGGRAFETAGLSPNADPRRLLADFLVIRTLFTGVPLPDRDTGDPFHPGRSRAVVDYILELGRPSLLSIGEMVLDPYEIDADYIRPQSWPGTVDPVGGFGTEFRLDRESLTVLLRITRQILPSGQVGVRTEGWRMVNVTPELRSQARHLAEHLARELWPTVCQEQFRRRVEPGLLQVGNLRSRVNLYGFGAVANAAIVTTDRLLRKPPSP
jgi:hypothetical protein